MYGCSLERVRHFRRMVHIAARRQCHLPTCLEFTMNAHRKPRQNVSNSATAGNTATAVGTATPGSSTPNNFSPGDALERLYNELVDVEALAHAAGEAVTELSANSSPRKRRSFARLYALVTRTASEASAALTLGENLVSALSAHMAARRAALALERGDR